jgi:phage baseplate assembly protein W
MTPDKPAIPGPLRRDYSFPLRINAVQRQAQQVGYAEHVAQMIRQFLFTSPGERINLPDFGGGLRRMVFAPITSELTSTSELLIRRGLEKYLGQHIELIKVTVGNAEEIDPAAIEVSIQYRLKETQEEAPTMLLQLP